MFIAALFTIVKIWKRSKYPSTDEHINKMLACAHAHTHTNNEILLSRKKNEILPFATT